MVWPRSFTCRRIICTERWRKMWISPFSNRFVWFILVSMWENWRFVASGPGKFICCTDYVCVACMVCWRYCAIELIDWVRELFRVVEYIPNYRLFFFCPSNHEWGNLCLSLIWYFLETIRWCDFFLLLIFVVVILFLHFTLMMVFNPYFMLFSLFYSFEMYSKGHESYILITWF